MPGPPRVAVVLVHRDQPHLLRETVAAFAADPLAPTVVVVDNGSDPRSAPVLDGLAPDVRVLRLGHNAGFGPGANAGMRWALGASYDVVALAPHDARPAPGTLAALVSALVERPRAGLVCADVGDGHRPVVDPYFGGITLPRRVQRGWEDCDYPHGTLLAARAACLEQVGLFDERYFAYCEEADLGLRARAAGWQVGIVQGARVHNPGMGVGSDAVDYLMARNTLLLVREHFGRYRAGVRTAILLVQVVRGTVRPSSRPWIFSARGRLWAVVDHLRGRLGPPPERLTRPSGTGRLERPGPVGGRG